LSPYTRLFRSGGSSQGRRLLLYSCRSDLYHQTSLLSLFSSLSLSPSLFLSLFSSPWSPYLTFRESLSLQLSLCFSCSHLRFPLCLSPSPRFSLSISLFLSLSLCISCAC